MANLNKVMLMGNLTRDPELRYTPSGTPVCEFGMAINRTYTSGDGQQREDTCFVDITMWGKRGVVISEYFHKGDPIFVEGRLNYDSWEGQDGKRRSKLNVVAENFEFLSSGRGSRGGSGGSSGGNAGGGYDQDRGSRGGRDYGRGGGQQQRRQPQEPPSDEGFDVADDEIPF